MVRNIRWTGNAALREATLALALVVGLGGCSTLIDVDGHQCETAEDCVQADLGDSCVRNVCVGEVVLGQGEAANPDGRCASDDDCGEAEPRCLHSRCVADDVATRFACEATEEPDDDVETIRYAFRVVEFASRKPPKRLEVKACHAGDVECSNPVATFESSDDSGQVELELPVRFLGYFDVKGDEMAALSYISRPLLHDKTDRDLQVPSRSTVAATATLGQTEVDATRGLALVEAFECSGKPAGGVHFTESSGEAQGFYIVNHVPNITAQVTVYDEANDVADGGFLNLPPGYVTFGASLGVDGPWLGEFNASVRAETVTFVDMYF
ncbi:MAG: hypothetical protein ABW321_13975 [Polyangiales bacterium]